MEKVNKDLCDEIIDEFNKLMDELERDFQITSDNVKDGGNTSECDK